MGQSGKQEPEYPAIDTLRAKFNNMGGTMCCRDTSDMRLNTSIGGTILEKFLEYAKEQQYTIGSLTLGEVVAIAKGLNRRVSEIILTEAAASSKCPCRK